MAKSGAAARARALWEFDAEVGRLRVEKEKVGGRNIIVRECSGDKKKKDHTDDGRRKGYSGRGEESFFSFQLKHLRVFL